MRRPWQVWLLYLAGLAVVIPAMAWLTWQVMFLDQAESLTRRQAEREELIGRALWRMDAFVTPLLAREASRPDGYYDAVAQPTEKDSSTKVSTIPAISPLLSDPPQFVLLHFHWLPGERIVSPQCPSDDERPLVCAQGIAEQDLKVYEARRQQLEISSSSGSLLAMLPTQSWSASRWDYLSENERLNEKAMLNNLPPVVMPAFPSGQSDVFEANDSQALNPPPNQTYRPAESEPTQVSQAPPTSRFVRSQRAVGQNDYEQRNSAYQQFAQQSVENLKRRMPDEKEVDTSLAASTIYREGAFRPVWVGGKLLFARRVQQGEQILVQGCWLDWNRLESQLREEVSDILPQFLLVPVFEPRQAALNRVLATLPVQVEVPPLRPLTIQWSPVRLALVAAWVGLVLAALAAAVTLQGMILLNERRASFVSAVTHELRTPLTTFRMYAEMLAEGMVPDPVQQQHYLNTLKTESDRLSHLVDNVLQYARLERGRPGKQRQRVTLSALLERMQSRLAERAKQVGLELQLNGSPQVKPLELLTDPAAIEQILFNLVDNAAKYAAESTDKRLHLTWTLEHRSLALRLVDHGPGIANQGETRLFIPFSKSANEAAESAPGVGLGLALSRRLARAIGGELTWEQTAGGGATFCLRLPRVA